MKKRLRKKLAKKQGLDAAAAIPDPISDWLVSLAVECWQISRLVPEFEGNKKQPLLRAAVENLTALLAARGVEIDDPTECEVAIGTTVTVALTEPIAGLPLGTRRVIETLSPNIFTDGKLARPARVILGVGSGDN
jgi:hypothetical protein